MRGENYLKELQSATYLEDREKNLSDASSASIDLQNQLDVKGNKQQQATGSLCKENIQSS